MTPYVYDSLKQKYEETVLLYKNGGFYNAQDYDAYILNYLFGYRIFYNYKNECLAGFPVYGLDNVLNTLDSYEINYIVLDGNYIVEEHEFTNNKYNDFHKKIHLIDNDEWEDSNEEIVEGAIKTGSKVTFIDESVGEEETLTIIKDEQKIKYLSCGGPYNSSSTRIETISNANIYEGTISESSPIAQALLGHVEGDVVTALLPDGMKTKLHIKSVI